MNVKDILRDTGFRYNKALGQNFITDANLLAAVADDANVGGEDTVIEIGTGAGTLTRALAERAERVISFEVDENLKDVLGLSLQGLDNVEVVFRDVLKMSDKDIEEITCGRPFRVAANLPYYVTTPMIMRFLESDLPVKSVTVMVQKEVADRLVANAGQADYAAITLAVRMRGDAVVTRQVSRNMFYPVPNVDSAVVRIDVDEDRLKGENKKLIERLVKSAFAMRRKTLANNLCSSMGISKEDAEQKISAIGFDVRVRGEKLSLEDFVALSHTFDGQGN